MAHKPSLTQLTELMTKADAAKILGITPAAVALMERNGHLAALRTAGGVRLFRRSEVERLARRRARKSSQ